MYTERTTAAAAAARDSAARDMTARSDAACREMDGLLPGTCGNMAFPYIAMQRENAQRYENREALLQGTLFPGLDLPFRKELRSRFPKVNEALLELMALDFAIDELGLRRAGCRWRGWFDGSIGRLCLLLIAARDRRRHGKEKDCHADDGKNDF